MRAGTKKAFGFTLGALVIVFLALAFSKPGRIQYHKWRVTAAKREHLRLASGQYRFTDQLREVFIGRTRTWAEIESAWKRHEQALVDLGFMKRVEYYARRGNVPSKANPGFAAVIHQIEQACPWWSYRVSQTESSLTVTATPEALELWKKLAPSVNLQEDKPKPDARRRSKKCRRSRYQTHQVTPVSVEWSRLFPANP